MNNVYVTGDTHGDPMHRFSFKKHPFLRECYKDIFIVAGDFGCPFGISAPYYRNLVYKSDCYQLNHIQEKMEMLDSYCLVILGNHDDRIASSQMPFTDHPTFGRVRKMQLMKDIYDHILVIDKPMTMKLQVNNDTYADFLLIPGAKSHDANVILDPDSPNFKYELKKIRREFVLWRIKNWEWWQDEDVDISALRNLLQNLDFPPDYIISHEAPARINEWYKRPGEPGRRISTEAQEYLEVIRTTIPFNTWVHGHYHFSYEWSEWVDDRMVGIFTEWMQLGEFDAN